MAPEFWLAFIVGCVWVIIGLEVLGHLDPDGNWDALVMGESIIRFGISLIGWPAVAAAMWMNRPNG